MSRVARFWIANQERQAHLHLTPDLLVAEDRSVSKALEPLSRADLFRWSWDEMAHARKHQR